MDVNAVNKIKSGCTSYSVNFGSQHYCIDFNHQKLVITIGDYLVRTSGILIHYVLCIGSIFAQDEEALRRSHLADSNIKLAMAVDLMNCTAKS